MSNDLDEKFDGRCHTIWTILACQALQGFEIRAAANAGKHLCFSGQRCFNTQAWTSVETSQGVVSVSNLKRPFLFAFEIMVESTVKDMGLAEFGRSEQSVAAVAAAADPHCARLGTVGPAEQRDGLRCGLCWPHIVYVPVPQVAAKIPEVAETILQKHISDDLRVQEVVNENLEVIKVPQEREDVPQSPEETVELVKLVSQERVQQRTVEGTIELVKLLTGTSATADRRGASFSQRARRSGDVGPA